MGSDLVGRWGLVKGLLKRGLCLCMVLMLRHGKGVNDVL